MSDRLFDLDEVPEVPIFREPRRSRGEGDARFRNDYPPEWDKCGTCYGAGLLLGDVQDDYGTPPKCPDCWGMGSVKARVRLEAGHRCVRCLHPYIPKGDAKMLGVEPSWREGGWSPCDGRCRHGTPIRYRFRREPLMLYGEPFLEESWRVIERGNATVETWHEDDGSLDPSWEVEAEWRILTVHHADGDKANLSWWNLLPLCQRDHLLIQAKVVMERVYPHEHSEWFKPYAAGYYAKMYLGLDLTREETTARLDELLALERYDAVAG